MCEALHMYFLFVKTSKHMSARKTSLKSKMQAHLSGKISKIL